ncbi:chymotrypsin-1-like [Culex pipiens pallens]|uniref:chymotrypsin-1-like n=1 Tax=Culex pipiens pallens TaxID=42434 RepID=UPI00195362DC|nr:chymotrypsin-1-like [Culex pipiens pallens]
MFKYAAVFVLAVATMSAATLKKPVSSEDRQGRIAGGDIADPNQFPYHAALQTADGLTFCGAAIVNQRWVITAGSCAQGKATSDVWVVVGTNRVDALAVPRHTVDRIVIHPNFDVNVYANDVAVLRVLRPFIFSESIQPITLGSDNVEAESNAVATGFGRTAISDSTPASFLRYVNVDVITNEECQEAFDDSYQERLHGNTVCTRSAEGSGICLGDAGGPLVIDDTLVGVISWGIPCGMGMPDVYARVSAHRAWVLVHTMI